MYFKFSCLLLLLCFSCKKKRLDIFDQGIINIHIIPDSIYKNDLVHPSIVYIPNGLGDQGYKWWMVGTPYPGSLLFRDKKLENPILFRGETNSITSPVVWKYVDIIAETLPNNGFNSDPCLFYDSSKLWIFWRENETDAVIQAGNVRGVFCASTTDGITLTDKRLICMDDNYDIDYNMAPCVFRDKDNNISLYATQYELRPKRINEGVALWNLSGSLDSGRFVLRGVSKLKGQGDFDYWHGDYFVQNSIVYLVASNEKGDVIKIAKSEDGTNFQFYNTPLITKSQSGYEYMYKPCARVIDGTFYLWHPTTINGVNTIISHSINWIKLIKQLEDGE